MQTRFKIVTEVGGDDFTMGKKEEKIPSQMRQRQALQKKHIPTKGLSRQTTRRLYKYYIEKKNPASDPRALAYGEHKRLEQRVEKGRAMTKKQYREIIRRQEKATREQVNKELYENISSMKYSHRFKSKKREDRFRYSFDPPKGFEITSLTVGKKLQALHKTYIPDLMETINMLYKRRGRFYKTRIIGSIIIYTTKNMPQDAVPRPTKFVEMNEFQKYLEDMLYQLLVIDIFRHYKEAIITLEHIDVFIRTRSTPSMTEQML